MFLKAVALGLSVPIAMKMARFATAQSEGPPKRFFVFYMPHGIAPEHYNPRVAEGDWTNFALDQTNESILGPLEPYKQYVNVYEGFKFPDLMGTHEGIINCLSGVSTLDSTTPRTTVEHVIAKGLGVKPVILGACSHMPFGLDAHGMLFWDGTPIDPQKDPSKAADELFGTGTGTGTTGEPNPPVDPNVELRNGLLTLTEAEIESLSGSLSGLTREQNKLAAHLAAVQSLKASGGGGMQSSCTGRPTLPTVEQVRSESAGQVIDPSGGNDYFYQEANFRKLLQAQLEVASQALICNAAQVIGLMPMYAVCEFDFGFVGQSDGSGINTSGSHHNTLSHATAQQSPSAQYNSPISVDNYLPEPRAPFARCQRWFAQQLVDNVVSALATTDDPAAPGTSVLDNTLIYWMSEIGDGANHLRLSMIEWPQVPSSLHLVTIGGAGGALKTGQVYRAGIGTDGANAAQVNRPAGDLHKTLAQAMGVNADFPDSEGAITEVLT
ncbi:MAG TPA: DUF1552 domain-containing protein [Polyangiaceae bacterium]|nr:DUF1552 domain-containing protein [Polyangiaceae bacterium]